MSAEAIGALLPEAMERDPTVGLCEQSLFVLQRVFGSDPQLGAFSQPQADELIDKIARLYIKGFEDDAADQKGLEAQRASVMQRYAKGESVGEITLDVTTVVDAIAGRAQDHSGNLLSDLIEEMRKDGVVEFPAEASSTDVVPGAEAKFETTTPSMPAPASAERSRPSRVGQSRLIGGQAVCAKPAKSSSEVGAAALAGGGRSPPENRQRARLVRLVRGLPVGVTVKDEFGTRIVLLDGWYPPVRPIEKLEPDELRLIEKAFTKGYSEPGEEDEVTVDWRDRAACKDGVDPDTFFPEKGDSTREAKRICRTCPVRAECLEYALERDERFGIWGGWSEQERRRLKRRAG